MRPVELTLTQKIFKCLLGAFLAFAGTGHLTWLRSEFLAQVPAWVPMDGDLVVVLSGIVEIVLGVALLFTHKRAYLAGLVTALFFVAVFPGNISQYINRIDAFGLDTDEKRLIRLFFQPVLIWLALWTTGVMAALKKRGHNR